MYTKTKIDYRITPTLIFINTKIYDFITTILMHTYAICAIINTASLMLNYAKYNLLYTAFLI